MNKDFDLLHVHIVGFSGQPGLRDPAAVARELRSQLEKMQAPGLRVMALAPLLSPADLLFAREATGLGMPLVVILAQSEEELRKTFAGDMANDVGQVLKSAAKIERLALSGEVDAATRIGQRLVDEADVLLALTEKTEPARPGDTAEVIAYASRRGRRVIRLSETDGGLKVSEFKTEKESTDAELGIEELKAMLGPVPPEPAIPAGLIKYFNACDEKATRDAPRVRRYALDIVMANAIASIAGGVGSSYPHPTHALVVMAGILTFIKFGSILLGLGIFAVMRHRESQSHWLALRLKAEVCRSAIATWSFPLPIDPITPDEVPELRRLIQALRYYRATKPAGGELTLDQFKASYGTRRLVDQHMYYHRQAARAVNRSSRATPVYWFLSGSALIVSALALIVPTIMGAHHHVGTWMNYFFIVVPTAAPALASWLVAWQAIEAVSRKKARFAEMARLTHQALVDLIHCHSWESAHHVVKQAEKHLLSEVLEWYAFVKYS